MAEEGSSSLQRAIAVLDVLGAAGPGDRGGVGVVEIARRIGREKSQVSRTLRTLADAGLAARDPETLGYRLGWRLFTLAAGAADQQLVSAAPDVLRRLAGVVNERAHLSVLVGRDVLTLMSEGATRAIEASESVGGMTPAHSTSSGRALLFDHSDDEVRQLLTDVDLAAAPRSAPHTVAELLDRLQMARRTGYALIDEEFEVGHVAAAAPVRDFRGRTIAAVNVSAPKYRIGRHLRRVGEQVQLAANQLAKELTRTSAPPARSRSSGPRSRPRSRHPDS